MVNLCPEHRIVSHDVQWPDKVAAPEAEPRNETSPATQGLVKSGRQDLNLRPSEPHSDALARLRHAPNSPATANGEASMCSIADLANLCNSLLADRRSKCERLDCRWEFRYIRHLRRRFTYFPNR
jgi:hypothetical protein